MKLPVKLKILKLTILVIKKKNKRKRAYSTPTYGLVENTDYDLHLTNIQNVISHTDAKRKRIIGNQNRLKECVQKQKNIMQIETCYIARKKITGNDYLKNSLAQPTNYDLIEKHNGKDITGSEISGATVSNFVNKLKSTGRIKTSLINNVNVLSPIMAPENNEFELYLKTVLLIVVL